MIQEAGAVPVSHLPTEACATILKGTFQRIFITCTPANNVFVIYLPTVGLKNDGKKQKLQTSSEVKGKLKAAWVILRRPGRGGGGQNHCREAVVWAGEVLVCGSLPMVPNTILDRR